MIVKCYSVVKFLEKWTKVIYNTFVTFDVVLNRNATVIYSGDMVIIDFKDTTFCIETCEFHYIAIS